MRGRCIHSTCNLLQERLTSHSLASTLTSSIGCQVAGYAKEGKKGKTKSDGLTDTDRLLLKILDFPDKQSDAYTMTPEEKLEWEARSKEYSRRRMQAHRKWQAELTGRLKLKNAAIKALPTEFLRNEAMREDHELFPTNRQIFTDTPPIWDINKTKKKDDRTKERLIIGTKRGR